MKRKYLFGHISFNWFEFVLEICKHWPLVTAVDHPQAYCDVFRVVLHVVSVQHLLVTSFFGLSEADYKCRLQSGLQKRELEVRRSLYRKKINNKKTGFSSNIHSIFLFL